MSEPGALYRGLGRERSQHPGTGTRKQKSVKGEAGSKQLSLAGAHPLKWMEKWQTVGQPPLPASSLVWCVWGVLRATSKEEQAGLRQHEVPGTQMAKGQGQRETRTR